MKRRKLTSKEAPVKDLVEAVVHQQTMMADSFEEVVLFGEALIIHGKNLMLRNLGVEKTKAFLLLVASEI